MLFIFLPIIFLPLAFQIQWQKNEGQENEAGGYQILLPTGLSKKHVFQCAQKMSASERKATNVESQKPYDRQNLSWPYVKANSA
jgi:hypothetical protein